MKSKAVKVKEFCKENWSELAQVGIAGAGLVISTVIQLKVKNGAVNSMAAIANKAISNIQSLNKTLYFCANEWRIIMKRRKRSKLKLLFMVLLYIALMLIFCKCVGIDDMVVHDLPGAL